MRLEKNGDVMEGNITLPPPPPFPPLPLTVFIKKEIRGREGRRGNWVSNEGREGGRKGDTEVREGGR